MSATALKSTKRRFSSQNHQNFEFFRLVPGSPTHTGLICGKTLEPNISSLGPFKVTDENSRIRTRIRIHTKICVPAHQKTESLRPTILRLSLILFSFSRTTTMSMGVRNCDTEMVMYSGRMDRSTVSIVPE
jgi:hypothetical protein